MKALQGQTLFDIAIQSCGGTEAAYALAKLNGLSVTDELVPGQELVLTDIVNPGIALYFKNKNIHPATLLAVKAQVIGSMVDTVTRVVTTIQSNLIATIEGQSLFDIAVQEFGSIEAAYALATINGLSVTDELTPGTLLQKTGIINKKIVSYYSDKNFKPATGVSSDSTVGGIEYWAIETEFLVS